MHHPEDLVGRCRPNGSVLRCALCPEEVCSVPIVRGQTRVLDLRRPAGDRRSSYRCWCPTYAKDEPRLWGFPFFYWYQLLWVFISAIAGQHLLPAGDAPRSASGGPRRDSVTPTQPARGEGGRPVNTRRLGAADHRHRDLRRRHGDGLHGGPLAPHRPIWTASTSGVWAAAASAPSSPGSCSAATSTRRTRSSPYRPRCTRPARSAASSRCRTRSWSTRSSSSSCPGCGRCRTATAT